MKQIRIRRPDDFHVHLRQSEMLARVIRYTAGPYARALVMPNLVMPVTNGELVERYRSEIEHAVRDDGCVGFQPLMTFYLTDETTRTLVDNVYQAGAVAGKMYIRGTTTNSHHGVTNPWMPDVFEAMQKRGLVLCVHGEWPEGDVLGWEAAFMKHLRKIALAFPKLRIVLEHITTRVAVETVCDLPGNVGATITAHHLCLTHNDIIGFGRIQPHHFCMPVAKLEEDRDVLIRAATGNYGDKFFFGSDSAPHDREKKECASGCAGLFTAPVALEVLATVFEGQGALDRLEAFTSVNGARFYGLPLNEGYLTIERQTWEVEPEINGIVPFRAGQPLSWRAV